MTDPITSAWGAQRAAMGAFIRSQRELAQMSLRELSKATQVSNAYLSQVERGMHDPTLKVLLQIGDALQLSLDDMLEQAGRSGSERPSVEDAVRADPVLTQAEKDALLAVYRSYRAGHAADAAEPGSSGSPASQRASAPKTQPGSGAQERPTATRKAASAKKSSDAKTPVVQQISTTKRTAARTAKRTAKKA